MEVEVGDRRGTFLFNSGYGTTAVTPVFAALVGCRPWAKVAAFRATGKRVYLPRCKSAKVKVHLSARRLPELAVINLARVTGSLASDLSGAVGLEAMAGPVVTRDVAHHRLIVQNASSLAAAKRVAAKVPICLVRRAEGASLTVNVAMLMPSGSAWMKLDTGNYRPALVDKIVAGLFGLNSASANVQK